MARLSRVDLYAEQPYAELLRTSHVWPSFEQFPMRQQRKTLRLYVDESKAQVSCPKDN